MKKITIILLSIILCLTFCSCGKPSNLYTVYVIEDGAKEDTYSSETVKYNDAKQSYTLPKSKDTQKADMKDVELVLGEQTFQLQYHYTYNRYGMEDQLNHYYTKDYSITASYRDDNGKLEYLCLNPEVVCPVSDSPITSEAQLKEACDEFVKQHVTDIEKYKVSIKTKIETSNYDEEFDKFVSVEEYTKATAKYEVHYNYYIDDVVTSDAIKITVRNDGSLFVFSLCMVGAFDKYSSIDIDQTKCDTLIEEQTTAMCTVENYQFTGSANTKTLIICDGVLCMLVGVIPTYEEQKTNEALHVEPIEMLIPIAK